MVSSKKAISILKAKAIPSDPSTMVRSTREIAKPEEHELERTFRVNVMDLPELPQPWCIVQGYFDCAHPEDEVSIRLIPSRKLAFVRRKSTTPNILRAKISMQISYAEGLKLLEQAPRVAIKERHLIRDEWGRAWLVDFFPRLKQFYVETEFDTEDISKKMDKDEEIPEWCGKDVTNDPEGYTRTRARPMTAGARQAEIDYAEENGSVAAYSPSEDGKFKWQEETGVWDG